MCQSGALRSRRRNNHGFTVNRNVSSKAGKAGKRGKAGQPTGSPSMEQRKSTGESLRSAVKDPNIREKPIIG